MSKQVVLLFHGLMAPPNQMERMHKYLEDRGFQVYQIKYSSMRHTIPEIIKKADIEIKNYISDADQVHFVGFSMGGLIIQAYLKHYKCEKLGRVVMLATPNNGSELADLFAPYELPRMIIGKNLNYLKTNSSKMRTDFNALGCDVGILAGNKPSGKISGTLLKGANDGRVTVESTKLDSMKDFMVLPFGHDTFPSHETVRYQTLHFLQHGSFDSEQKVKRDRYILGMRF